MISASEPQEFSPSGRAQLERHPGEPLIKPIENDLNPESFLDNNYKTEHNINEKEFWSLRPIKDEINCEEELYVCGQTAVWSYGSSNSEHSGSSRHIKSCYTLNSPIRHALWCNFHISPQDKLFTNNSSGKEDLGVALPSICLVDSEFIKIFTEKGEDFSSTLQFQVSNVWSCKYGIILERGYTKPNSINQLNESPQLPTVFSLLHPLDEIAPVIVKQANHLSYLIEPSQKIVFINEEPSLCMIYDSKTGLHSVWRIRKSLKEESQYMCGLGDVTNQSHGINLLSSFDPMVIPNSGGSFTGSMRFSSGGGGGCNRGTPRTSLGPHLGNLLDIPKQSPNQKRYSLGATHVQRLSPSSCLSTHSIISPHTKNKFLQKASPAANSADSRLFMSYCAQDNVETRPVFPEICFDYLWIESSSKDLSGVAASKAFLSTDLSGLNYLCYLVKSRNQLICVRLEKTIESKLIFGVQAVISARDAASLPHLQMIVTLDLTGGIVLYTGVHLVSKVHIGGIPSALTTSNYLSLNLGQQFTCHKYPRRNSMLASSRPASSMESVPRFADEAYLLSPVTPAPASRSTSLITATPAGPAASSVLFSLSQSLEEALNDATGNESIKPRRLGALIGIRDPVNNRITLEYSDGSLYRIKLPDMQTSPLIARCLTTLKQVLPKELALLVAVTLYGTRNAPGSQDIAPAHEWLLFSRVLFELLGFEVDKLAVIREHEERCLGSGVITNFASPGQAPKKKRSSDAGTNEDFDYVIQSEYHRNLGGRLAAVLGLRALGSPSPEVKSEKITGQINSSAPLFQHMPLVLYSLHLLYEDLKLDSLLLDALPLLAPALHQLAFEMKLPNYVDFYWRDYPDLWPPLPKDSKKSPPISQITENDLKKLNPPSFITPDPPQIFQHIYNLLRNVKVPSYPYINQVNKRSRDMVQITQLLMHGQNELDSVIMTNAIDILPLGQRGFEDDLTSRECFTIPPNKISKGTNLISHKVIEHLVRLNYTQRDIENLPASLSLLISHAIYESRENPPPDWTSPLYKLIGREDLAAAQNPSSTLPLNISGSTKSWSSSGNLIQPSPKPVDKELDDGLDALDSEVMHLRFSRDQRVGEVKRLLQSSHPVKIDISQRPDVTDHEFIEEQEKHLYAMCTRTMALPIGRGMATLHTLEPVITESLPIPRLCLTGKAPPRGTTVDLTHIEVVPNMNLWPTFHNGVAAGLRLTPYTKDIDSDWILFNKPKTLAPTDVPIDHAGFIMALGLNGHLSNLAMHNLFDYLIHMQEMPSVGILIGIAATKRGTMNVDVTKALSIHVESLLPPTSLELNIPHNVQVAALLSVGLLYEGTAHRHIAESLLSEIGRPPGPEMENSSDRESYSLAAGLGLGLVLMGKGSSESGLNDLSIPDTLNYYMIGGRKRPLTGSQKDKYKVPSYQIREGDCVNIDVTSPAATLALGMIYFNTCDRSVAEWIRPPETSYLLDLVKPDFLLLRVVARALILWSEVKPTVKWVESNLPDVLKPYSLDKPQPNDPEVYYETMYQAYCNIIAGACMALGLRYAGSADIDAYKTLLIFTKMFTSMTLKSVAELAGKATVETCLNVIVLAFASVMAGTGDIAVLRVCRYLHSRVGPNNGVATYGSHLATHMALGLLFLGGGRYTLSSKPQAVAALICAFFPKFPTHSNDNRYHLQAFRHLYVLAVEPRLLIPHEINSNKLCYAHVTAVYINGKEEVLKAPAMLPELDQLKQVVFRDDRYWPIVFQRDRNWDQLENLLKKSGYLSIKRKAGCLSYKEDPQGFRSLLAQTLTSTPTLSWSLSPEVIRAFTSDPAIVNFCQHFLQNVSESASDNEKLLIRQITPFAYECITQDKLSILPLWLKFIKGLQELRLAPSVYLLWQFKLLAAQIIDKPPNNRHHFTDIKPTLIECEKVMSIKRQLKILLSTWEREICNSVKSYVQAECLESDSAILAKLVVYLTFYDIPTPKEPLQVKDLYNPIAIHLKLKGSYETSSMLKRLFDRYFKTD